MTSYPIKQDLIPGLPRTPYRKGIGAYEGVVDHSTATPEATDEAEDRYSHNNWKTRKAFPHAYVDWDSITQVADFDYQAWGAGNGNPRYVHVELCETKDPVKFKASYDRYVWLTAELLRRKNLGVTDGVTLVSHDWVSKHLGGTDHVDPIAYLASHGVSWAQHVANVRAMYNSFFVKTVPADSADGKLTRGEKGPNVKLLNQMLHTLTYTTKTDDLFDQYTEAALKAFQKDHGLPQDGVYTSAVGDVMVKAIAAMTPAEFRIKVLAPELWYYDKPDWNAKKDTVHKDQVFTVIQTLTVDGAKMYKLKSGTYITANPQYVGRV